MTVAAERDYQFCTELIVRGEQLPAANEVRAAMHRVRRIGGGGGDQRYPEGPCAYRYPGGRLYLCRPVGNRDVPKADDMRAQHRALSHLERRPVAVVTDTSADLPDAVLDRHHIAMVPLQIVFGDEVFQDRVGMRPEEFYRRLRSAKQLPTTSQPTPADFVRVFRSALEEADEVVAVLLGSAALRYVPGGSGGRQGGGARAGAPGGQQGRDALPGAAGAAGSRAGGIGMAGAGKSLRELERVRRQSGVLLTVDTYDNLIRSGRVSRGKAWLAGMLDVRPILGLDSTGRVVPVDRVRGREAVICRMLALVEKNLTPRPKAVRFGVVPRRGPGARGADPDRPGGRLRAARLFRVPGHRRAGGPHGSGSLGGLLAGGGRNARPACQRGRLTHDPPATGGAASRQASAPGSLALEAADDLKARDMVALDLRGLNDATDWFVIASGTSDAHVRGIAQSVVDRLAAAGIRVHHVEGLTTGRWVLLDFVDVVVHLFHPEARAFYQLERLWNDAPRFVPAVERKSP